MARFDIPDVVDPLHLQLTDFLGVDYNDNVENNRRSPKMINFINKNGYLESRNGHKILLHLENAPVNGVWNVDANDDIFIVHCGTNLYEVDKTFTNKVLIGTELANVKSCGIYLDEKLFILDGKRALIYGKFDKTWECKYADTIGYIPTTFFNMNPDGTGGTELEVINMLSQYRINAFLTDGTSTVYKVRGENLADEMPIVTQLKEDGTKQVVTDFTYDKVKGTVTFKTAPVKFAVEGTDSIFIQYKKDGDIDNYVNACKFATTFGYGGVNNRIFIAGNEGFGEYYWFSDINNPTYFPTRNFGKAGIQPITGFSRLTDGNLGVQKKVSDTDCTVYYVTYYKINNKESFPIRDCSKVIGCLNDKCCQNFINDPIFLSEIGVYSLNQMSSDITTNYANERSYYINKHLLAEPNLEEAVGIVNKEKYYLAVNNHVYIADKRYLSQTSDSLGSYQYEWFYWEDVPVRCWFNWNNKLYFGDTAGNIRTFTTGYQDDVVVNGEIIKQNVNVYWESALLDFNNPVRGKTVKRVFCQLNPFGNTDISLGYNTMDGFSEITTMNYEGIADNFTRTIQEKEKIAKIMFLQMVVKNNTEHKCSFNNIILEYVISGKYRGD